MARQGKKFLADLAKQPQQALPVAEAVSVIKSFRDTKFDQSIEVVLHLGLDTKQSDQSLRGAVALPHGVGATKKVIAFVSADKVEKAKAAGAIEAGADDLVAKIEGGWLDFDVVIAEPAMMRVVAKLGKQLGPKGLMPSPKAGTVTPQIEQAIKEYAAGKVEFRNDAGGNVSASVGKKSFPAEKIADNVTAFIEHIEKLKPATVKGQYIKRIAIAGTMTPSVTVAR